eukprot:SAG31_NODE_7869_length_1578_cov_1.362407_2_plen_143_part_00
MHRGPACETLDLLPAPPQGAYGYAPNRSSWGSHVFRYRGEYHGYFAEWWGNCGVQSWTHASHIVHATADTAAGPFQFQDVSLGCEATNPHAIYDNRTDTFTLFHLGDGCGGCSASCTGIDGHAWSQPWNETFPPRQSVKNAG